MLTATFHSLHAGKWEISRGNLNRKEPSMNADVLTTKVTEGIAVIILGSAKRMYFDAEMGDALTDSLQEFAGDPNIRVVIVTGGAPGYFNRHFSIPALIEFS